VKVGGEMVSLVKVEEELNKLLLDDVVFCAVGVPNFTKGADIVAAITPVNRAQKNNGKAEESFTYNSCTTQISSY
jgi:hypothetical protein